MNAKKLENYRKDSLVGAILGFVFRIALALAVILIVYKAMSYCYDFDIVFLMNQP